MHRHRCGVYIMHRHRCGACIMHCHRCAAVAVARLRARPQSSEEGRVCMGACSCSSENAQAHPSRSCVTTIVKTTDFGKSVDPTLLHYIITTAFVGITGTVAFCVSDLGLVLSVRRRYRTMCCGVAILSRVLARGPTQQRFALASPRRSLVPLAPPLSHTYFRARAITSRSLSASRGEAMTHSLSHLCVWVHPHALARVAGILGSLCCSLAACSSVRSRSI
jgi:Asp/Glu/hydantoin racemase